MAPPWAGVGGLVPRLQRGGGASQCCRRLVAGRSQTRPLRCPKVDRRSGGRSLPVVGVDARSPRSDGAWGHAEARRSAAASGIGGIGDPRQQSGVVGSADRRAVGRGTAASASHTLQTMVSRLRGGLGADRVETVAPGYRLRVERGRGRRSAVRGVGARLGSGLPDRPEAAAARLEEALALWRGRPYEEFADEEFARPRWRGSRSCDWCAVEEHAAAVVELGRPGRGDRGARGRDRGGAVPRAAASGVDAGVGACGPPGRGVTRVRRVSAAYSPTRWALVPSAALQAAQRRHRASASRPRLGAHLRAEPRSRSCRAAR